MSDLFADKLNWFKRNEKAEAVLVVADEPRLVKIAVAWPNIAVRTRTPLSQLKGDTPLEVWQWLWANAEFSCDELLEISDAVPFNFRESLARLIANRVLYPDGTLNGSVQRYLRRRALSLFDRKPKKPATRQA